MNNDTPPAPPEIDEAAPPRLAADRPRAGGAPVGADVGDALRSVYQRTVEESVPDEMIDLLGRLD